MLINMVDEESGERMTKKQIRDELLTIFVAGYETTSITLAWSGYYLAGQPEIQQKVRAEVDHVLAGRVPTFADLPQLTYTRRVLQEALRLRSPAWFFARQTAEDDVIDGRFIPAGSLVMPLLYSTHRHPAVWDRPEQFDPDRFTPERTAARHRFAWTPFGAGQHMCIGREFALMEGQMALALLLQRFQFAPVADYVPRLQLTSTMRTKDGILVNVIKRKD